ncbi:MAG: hypothetical protein NZU63_02050 [Gemmataceae bacterium]|nr:hypothetical protein [Gemmataceae bacterium]MDW8242967.1 hypothetical protein [Thermogemmata sp.]
MKTGLFLREIVGWLLLIGGLGVFALALLLLLDRRIFEAVPAVGVGFVIFRGGIHLLKVAAALRAVWEWQNRGGVVPRRPVMSSRPLGPTTPISPSNVIPGRTPAVPTAR